MLMQYWSEISWIFSFCVFGVDYFKAKKCVFYTVIYLSAPGNDLFLLQV